MLPLFSLCNESKSFLLPCILFLSHRFNINTQVAGGTFMSCRLMLSVAKTTAKRGSEEVHTTKPHYFLCAARDGACIVVKSLEFGGTLVESAAAVSVCRMSSKAVGTYA